MEEQILQTSLWYSPNKFNYSDRFHVGFCVESPKEVLKYLLKNSIMVGGYRYLEVCTPSGQGLIIKGTDQDPIRKGTTITGTLESSLESLKKEGYTNLIGNFSRKDLRHAVYSGLIDSTNTNCNFRESALELGRGFFKDELADLETLRFRCMSSYSLAHRLR